ncbi:MAG: GntR family transcriptional regulator [Dermatophilus congolensis]|nr:GntR family transcriptional regulator [Dermatophilus congolensis]
MTATDIAAALRAAISSGSYAPDDQLPGENALMSEHGVARMTARARQAPGNRGQSGSLTEHSAAGQPRSCLPLAAFLGSIRGLDFPSLGGAAMALRSSSCDAAGGAILGRRDGRFERAVRGGRRAAAARDEP